MPPSPGPVKISHKNDRIHISWPLPYIQPVKPLLIFFLNLTTLSKILYELVWHTQNRICVKHTWIRGPGVLALKVKRNKISL